MAKIEKIGNIQIVDNKEDKFFYFPMISMACTGSGNSKSGYSAQRKKSGLRRATRLAGAAIPPGKECYCSSW